MTTQRKALVLAMFAVTALGACPRKVAVWLEPPESAWLPTFGVANRLNGEQSVGVVPVRVQECDARSSSSIVWELEPDSTLQRLPIRIQYGQAPRGYLTVVGPTKLTRGRYCFQVSGITSLIFSIDAEGQASTGR